MTKITSLTILKANGTGRTVKETPVLNMQIIANKLEDYELLN